MLLAKLRACFPAAPQLCAWLAASALLCASCQTGSEPASWSMTRGSMRTLESTNIPLDADAEFFAMLAIVVLVPLTIDVLLLPFTIPYDRAQGA